MRVLCQTSPAPRLLNSVASEVRETKPAGEGASGNFSLKGASLFSGNGRAIFLGIVLGAAILTTISIVYSRHVAARRYEEVRRKLVTVSTHRVSPPQSEATPAPIVVRISADLLHVTAISLGHPRMAIINGHQVTEGDQLTVHTPAASVAITLRVLKILDGRIDLSDGTQVITARLEMPRAIHSKS